jgi:NADH-quinone oxidoreductase subunit E/NADP-reducing hydrogenase subunit HndA
MSRVKIELQEKVVNRIKEICRSFNNDPGELINVLHQTQHEFGYLPAEVQEVIASEMNISVAKVYGVVTFTISLHGPKGKHPVSICTGTACYVRGAEKVLENFVRTED